MRGGLEISLHKEIPPYNALYYHREMTSIHSLTNRLRVHNPSESAPQCSADRFLGPYVGIEDGTLSGAKLYGGIPRVCSKPSENAVSTQGPEGRWIRNEYFHRGTKDFHVASWPSFATIKETATADGGKLD